MRVCECCGISPALAVRTICLMCETADCLIPLGCNRNDAESWGEDPTISETGEPFNSMGDHYYRSGR